MSKLTALAPLDVAQADDVIPIVDVHDFGMAPTGTTKIITVADLLAGLQPVSPSDTSGVTDLANIQGLVNLGGKAILGPGTFYIDAVINGKIAGLGIQGAGPGNTVIEQVTANTPILQVAGQGQKVSGLNLRWATQQTSGQTSSIGIEFGDDTVGSCFMSHFEDIYIELANCALATNPAITTVAGLFSCTFENIHILGFSFRAISLIGGNNVGAGDTGCHFNNTYISNNFSGSDVTSSSFPVFMQVWSEVEFTQLNIEHAGLAGAALVFPQCGNVVINGLHLEHLELPGTPGIGLIGIGTGNGTLQVNGLSIEFCTFSGTSYNSIAQVTGGSNQNFILNGLYFPAASNTDSTPGIALVDFNSATGVSAQVTGINGQATQGYTENAINAGAGSQLVITDGAQITYAPPLTGPGMFACAPTQYAPGTLTTLATSSATMAAVSSANVKTGSFVAPASGSVWVTGSLVAGVATSGDTIAFALAAHGTVTPLLSNVVTFQNNTQKTLYPLAFLVTGLTPGTSYTLDLLFSSPAAVAATVYAIGQTTTTPTGANTGAPVMLAVQAV